MESQLLYWDVPITKSEKQDDGTLVVWGPCTSSALDHDRQIVDQDWAEKALGEWINSGANVRYMHQPDVIGKGLDTWREGDTNYLRAKIVDPVAVLKFEEDLLRAFSIGISSAKLDFRRNPLATKGVICGGTIPEVSGVDRPSNPDCLVQVVKGEMGETFAVGEIWEDGAEDYWVEKCACGCDDDPDGIVVEKMSTQARNKLPDSAFGYIDPEGGRHFPIHDEKHVRLAVQLLSTSKYGPKARKKVLAAAKRYGIQVSDDGKMIDVEAEKADGDGDADDKGAKCKTCKGSGKIKDGNMDCPTCKGKGTVTKAVDPNDEKVDEDIEQLEKDQAADEADEKSDVKAPYVFKRLHDHLCMAFSAEDVAEEYPGAATLQKALDPNVFLKAVQVACQEDLGTGKYAHDIATLGGAYGDAIYLKATEQAILDDARGALHNIFKSDYPSVSVKPGAVTPGMFRRPFITSHTASMHASGGPHNPSSTKVPEPGDFERGLITSGRERSSPMHAPPNNVSNEKRRTFYTNNARDQAAQVMQQLHDHITATYPGMCPMANTTQETMPNNQEASLHAVSGAGHIGKSEEVDAETVQKMIDAAVGASKDKKAKKLQKMIAERDEQIESLMAAVEELQKAPDPSVGARLPGAAAYNVLPYVPKAVGATQDSPVDVKVAEADALKNRLLDDALSGDKELAGPALDKLRATFTDTDALAEAIVARQIP